VHVLLRRRRIAGRVVVHEDQVRGGLEDRRPEDLARVDDRGREAPLRDLDVPRRPFWLSSSATRKTSFFLPSRPGPKYPATSSGLDSRTRPPFGLARSRRDSSIAAPRRTALAMPSPPTHASSCTSRSATAAMDPNAARSACAWSRRALARDAAAQQEREALGVAERVGALREESLARTILGRPLADWRTLRVHTRGR
jgi:hypothetical protein